MVRRRPADPVRPGIRAHTDRGGGRRGPGRAPGFRARGRHRARRGRRLAHAAARIPGRLLRLGPGGPHARRRPRPATVCGAGRAGRLGQAAALPVLDHRARGPGRGAVAAPRRAPHRRRHHRLHLAGAARAAAPPAGVDPLRPYHRAGDHGRVHDQRRPVRRRAHPPVAGHAAPPEPAGRPRDAGVAALAARVPGGLEAGPHVLPQLPSHPGRAHRAVVGDHPAGRRGVRARRRGIRRRAPPPRAALGPRCDRPRAGWHGRPLRRRQPGGRLRAPADPGRPRARAPGQDPDLPRRPPDHRRAPGPPRRGDPRDRGPPRRGHPRHRPPVTPPVERKGTAMTRMTPLLERNEQFARAYTPMELGPPTAQVLIVTCLDHRVDPAIILGLQLGDAVVIRNAGGRVTPAVIDDIAYLAYLAGQLFGEQVFGDSLFEVAVVHHTQCGTGFLADPSFRRQAAEATGLSETALEASAVADPHTTVKADVERLLTSPLLSPKVSVSGHVYDVATGRVTTTLDARYP